MTGLVGVALGSDVLTGLGRRFIMSVFVLCASDERQFDIATCVPVKGHLTTPTVPGRDARVVCSPHFDAENGKQFAAYRLPSPPV